MENESNEVIRVKFSTLYKTGGFLIIAIMIFMLFNFLSGGSTSAYAKSSSITGNIVANSEYIGDAQQAKMWVEGAKYIITPSSFKPGIPVRIEADISRMPGCSKTVVIPAFNIKKTLTENDNIIEFTPNKPGTFNIMCGMAMYKGTFTVLQPDGTNSTYVEKPVASGASCGGSGGGCGCGSIR